MGGIDLGVTRLQGCFLQHGNITTILHNSKWIVTLKRHKNFKKKFRIFPKNRKELVSFLG